MKMIVKMTEYNRDVVNKLETKELVKDPKKSKKLAKALKKSGYKTIEISESLVKSKSKEI